MDNNVDTKSELAIRSINASSGRVVISVAANFECGGDVGINTFFENAFGKNKLLHLKEGNDDSRNNIS